MAYHMQMLSPDGIRLGPAHLWWLSASARASALGLVCVAGEVAGRVPSRVRVDG